MAFSLTATVGSTSINLSDKSPYSLVSLKGAGGAEIRRVTSRGPSQHGDTDKGYRLAPRILELVIGIEAATNAALDGYRDTLTSFFKPLPSTPIKLRYTRDDTEVRQIDCYTVGDIKIDLIPDYRVGHYHQATIQLRAADPSFYDPVPGTVTVTGAAGLSPTWYLAGGLIGTAQVLMSGGTPGLGEAWSYTGSLGTATGWTLAWRSGKESGAGYYAYGVDNNTNFLYSGTPDVYFEVGGSNYLINGLSGGGDDAMPPGTQNYFNTYRPQTDSGYSFFYRTVTSLTPTGVFGVPQNLSLVASTGKWRTNLTMGTGWSETIHLYALYSPYLSESQMNALSSYMGGGQGGSVSQILSISYEGDLPSYPTINLRGPITGARITNSITNAVLDFGTAVIGAGTTVIINTDPIFRTVLQGSTNRRGDLTSDSDLGDWFLVPAPRAIGGTNTIAVEGSNTGTATQVSIVYTNRYMGV